MKLYVAGPMRGRSQFNFPAFDDASATLRTFGHEVINPAEHDRESGFDPSDMTGNENLADLGFDLRTALAWDLQQISECDGVVVLDGWENSSGARAEVALAHALGLVVAPVEAFRMEYLPEDNGLSAVIDESLLIKAVTPPSGKLIEVPAVRNEVRVTSETGGQKGSKEQRYDLIPVEPLRMLATLYGRGAEKYDDNNWRKGYDWKLSYAAMQRHLNQFWGGEDIDPEMGVPHVINAAWHCFTLAQFMLEHPDFDSRARRG